jgi:hypothetical protein
MNRFPIEVNNPNPVLNFELSVGKPTSTSSRFLTVHGQQVFDLGIICETCSFLYTRLSQISLPLQPEELSSLLRDGLKSVDEGVLETVTKLLPSGQYAVGLITILPEFIKHSGYVGYGSVEESFYFAGTDKFDEHGEMQQAIVPLFHPESLKNNIVEEYKKQLNEGAKPTALAISIAEGKHFMSGSGYESPDCISLMHFLIDGHHKVYAASETGKPITVLSFLFDYEWAGLTTTHQHNPPMMDVMFERYYSNQR